MSQNPEITANWPPPTTDAAMQTQEYATNHTITGIIADGFRDPGRVQAGGGKREILVVDARSTADMRLANFIQEARALCTHPDVAQYGDMGKLFAIAQLITSRTPRPSDVVTAQQALDAQAGREIPIGYFINNGQLSPAQYQDIRCRQRAVLLQKVAAEVGLNISLHRGYLQYPEAAENQQVPARPPFQLSEEPHAWNTVNITGQEYIVDLRGIPLVFNEGPIQTRGKMTVADGYFALMTPQEFTTRGGFPVVDKTNDPTQIYKYLDANNRFLYGIPADPSQLRP